MPYPTLLYILRTVWARTIKFYGHINTNLPYICTAYDINNYFRSEATAKKIRPKCRLRRLQVEFLEKGLGEDRQIHKVVGDNRPTNLLDMTSLVTSGRPQNATEYCTKMMRKTGPAGQKSNNSATI